MRSREADPLGADVVHMGEDGRDGPSVAGWFGVPNCRGKIFDEDLVDAFVSGEDPDGGLAELGGVHEIIIRVRLTRTK